jgi:hypothetical protein
VVVGLAVVVSAEQAEVVGGGGSALGPVGEVVVVAPAGGNIAAGVGAVLVPLVEGPPEGG